MKINMVGAFVRNSPFGTEIAFAKGLKDFGHEVFTIDPDYPDQVMCEDPDATIVFKQFPEGKYLDIHKRIGGKKIVYQPDDLRFPHIRDLMLGMVKHCDHALTFDNDGVNIAKLYGYKSARALLPTADPDIYRPRPEVEKTIDAVFVGSLSPGANHRSRVHMINVLRSIRGLKVGFLSNIFDIDKITEVYSSARVVLNHATDVGQPFGSGFGYQCRHFEAGMTMSCLLSNTVTNDDSLKNFATFSDERTLVQRFLELLESKTTRERYAQDLYNEIQVGHLPIHRAAVITDFIQGLP